MSVFISLRARFIREVLKRNPEEWETRLKEAIVEGLNANAIEGLELNEKKKRSAKGKKGNYFKRKNFSAAYAALSIRFLAPTWKLGVIFLTSLPTR